MGYIKPEYVVFQTNDYHKVEIKKIDDFIGKQEEDVKKHFAKFDFLINGYVVYFMCWDGSKEGWLPSDKYDKVRIKFIKIIKEFDYPYFLHFRVGGDDEDSYEIYDKYEYEEEEEE